MQATMQIDILTTKQTRAHFEKYLQRRTRQDFCAVFIKPDAQTDFSQSVVLIERRVSTIFIVANRLGFVGFGPQFASLSMPSTTFAMAMQKSMWADAWMAITHIVFGSKDKVTHYLLNEALEKISFWGISEVLGLKGKIGEVAFVNEVRIGRGKKKPTLPPDGPRQLGLF